MASSTPTRLQQLVLATSVVANALLGGHVLYVSGSQHVTGNLSGSGTLAIAGRITQPGGEVPVMGTLSGSGQLSLQNPLAEPLKCTGLTVNVTTAASPVTMVDVNLSTAPGNVGTSLFDNLVLSAGLKTATGTSVATGDGPVAFRLDEAGGTNDYIYFSGVSGSGQSLAGTVHATCYQLN